MTVTYYPKIATIKFLSTLKILKRWRGSLYKVVLPDIAMFCAIYACLSLLYRFAFTEAQRELFCTICVYAREYSGTTTVTFCLGFYVAHVLGRWWEYFRTLPWMFTPGYHIRQTIIPPCAATGTSGNETKASHTFANKSHTGDSCDATSEDRNARLNLIRKQFDEALQIRLDLVRYLLLSWIWMLRRISKPVLVRFKPHENLSDSSLLDKLKVMNSDPYIQKYFPKLLTDDEIESIIVYAKKLCGKDYDKYEPDHFIPSSWATDLVLEAQSRGYVRNKYLGRDLIQTFRDFRGGLGVLKLMDMFNVPLVYTQVVSLCMYIYFILNCFAQQFTDHSKPDVYVPVPFILQMAFLFGWLRVSEVCLNPFGEDDDDFPTWQILNMNLETAYKMAHVFDLDLVKEEYAASLAERELAADKAPPSEKKMSQRVGPIRRKSNQSNRSNLVIDAAGGPSPSMLAIAEATLRELDDTHESNQEAIAIGNTDSHSRLHPLMSRTHEAIGNTDSHSRLHGNWRDSEKSVLLEEEDKHDETQNDYHTVNYEKFKKMYDRPVYIGSALENELARTRRSSSGTGPLRAPSKLNLFGNRKLSSVLNIHEDASLSRSNLANSRANIESGSKSALTSSKSNIHQPNQDDAKIISTVYSEEDYYNENYVKN